MNAVVQASPLTLGVVATLNDVSVSVSIYKYVAVITETPRLHTFKTLSINGHSLKAINPEFKKVGELTTLAMA
jgi:hypothetical protein